MPTIMMSADTSSYSRTVMDYLRMLSKDITLKTDDGIGLMEKKYEKLGFIHPDSCLSDYLSKAKRISEFDSENIMYKLISDLLNDTEFSEVSVANHVPLNMIVNDVKKLDSDEIKFKR